VKSGKKLAGLVGRSTSHEENGRTRCGRRALAHSRPCNPQQVLTFAASSPIRRVQHITRQSIEHASWEAAAAFWKQSWNRKKCGLHVRVVSGGGTRNLRHRPTPRGVSRMSVRLVCGHGIEYEEVQLFAGGNRILSKSPVTFNAGGGNNHRGWPTIDGGFKCFSIGRPDSAARTGRTARRCLPVLRRRVWQNKARSKHRHVETRSEDRTRHPALRPDHQSA